MLARAKGGKKGPVKRALLGLFSAGLACVGLGCDSTPTATLQLDLGGETDVFTRDPVPTTIVINAIDTSGNSKNLFTGPVTDSISLPDQDQNDEDYIDITASDATGKTQVHGRTLPFTFGALDDTSLDVFVQRTGELARMPGDVDAREAPLVDVVTGRYVLVAGGTTNATLYDVLSWGALGAPPTFERIPESVVITGTVILLVDDAGASTIDLSDSSTTELTAPTGATFANVVGGSPVYADDGTAYLIGATRTTGAPTATVLKVATDGTLSFASLANPRLGAAAVWIEGRGVIVVGGSATAPAIEILSADGTSAAALSYPPVTDATLSVAAIDATHVIAGATPALYDLSCGSMCNAAPWKAPAVTLVHADYFPLPGLTTDFLAVGWENSGASHVFRITAQAATEVPLKVPRQHARGVALPNGAVAVVGGAAQGESYFAN